MADALEARELAVRIGAATLLDNVSFDVTYGSLRAVVGPNGAGKSTLIKSLLGLVPHTGRVLVDGSELAQLSAADRARTIAYVPQRSSLATGIPVRDVVAQARYAYRSRFGLTDPNDAAVTRAIEQTGLEPFARRAYDTLSGGEQRRVLIARALATGAKVLLFDEPTAGLDIAYALRFFELTRGLKAGGYAIVCVLHDLAEAKRHADRVLLLSAGRTVADGPAADVLSEANIVKVYGVHSHEAAAVGFSLDGQWP